MTQQMERKSLNEPDELRPFKDGKGRAEIVMVGGLTLGRGVFEPGWRWSTTRNQSHGCEQSGRTTTSLSVRPEGRVSTLALFHLARFAEVFS